VWSGDAGALTDALAVAAEDVAGSVAGRAAAAGVETVDPPVLRGTPHREIVDYAARSGTDLVAMGTHGRTGLDRYLLGSVTERVVRRSPTPVLAVPYREEPADGSDGGR
jgi:nucleotide-binding universal stress UspA family protein